MGLCSTTLIIKSEMTSVNSEKKESPDNRELTRRKLLQFDFFLSHNVRDTKTIYCDSLQQKLVERGFYVFLDDKSIRLGVDYKESIKQSLSRSNIVVVVISSNYHLSEECIHELNVAVDLNKIIIPIFWDIPPMHIHESIKNKIGLIQGIVKTPNENLTEFLLRSSNLLISHEFGEVSKMMDQSIKMTCNATIINMDNSVGGCREYKRSIQEINEIILEAIKAPETHVEAPMRKLLKMLKLFSFDRILPSLSKVNYDLFSESSTKSVIVRMTRMDEILQNGIMKLLLHLVLNEVSNKEMAMLYSKSGSLEAFDLIMKNKFINFVPYLILAPLILGMNKQLISTFQGNTNLLLECNVTELTDDDMAEIERIVEKLDEKFDISKRKIQY